MIAGLEFDASPLTYHEMDLVQRVINSFQKHHGKENAITATEIKKKMRVFDHNLTSLSLRKIIAYIRREDLVMRLVGDNHGYYIETDSMAYNIFLSEMQANIQAQTEVLYAMKKQ